MSRIIIEGSRFLRNLEEVDPGLTSVSWTVDENCPICNRPDEVVQLAELRGTESSSMGTALCMRCLHCFQNRRPDATWLAGYYRHQWDERGRDQIGLDPAVTKAGDTEVFDYCHGVVGPGARVLDVGCGFGEKLLPFKKHGCEVIGIEPSEHRADYCSQRMGIDCRCIGIEEIIDHFGDEKFDLIYSSHVLEHVSDPVGFLQNVRSVLEEGGLLYLAVPNILGTFLPWVFHFAPHISLFSRHSLHRMLAGEGFDVISSVESRELKVLARVSQSIEVPSGVDDDLRQEFLSLLSEKIVDTFYVRGVYNEESSSRLSVFFKSTDDPMQYFNHELLSVKPSTVITRLMLRAAGNSRIFERLARSRLLHWWFGRYPAFRYFGFRIEEDLVPTSVRQNGFVDFSLINLPVEISYPNTPSAPFWVK